MVLRKIEYRNNDLADVEDIHVRGTEGRDREFFHAGGIWTTVASHDRIPDAAALQERRESAVDGADGIVGKFTGSIEPAADIVFAEHRRVDVHGTSIPLIPGGVLGWFLTTRN